MHEPQTQPLSDEFIRWLIERHTAVTVPALGRLWEYYRNDLDFSPGASAGDERRYAAAQQQGLPRRLAGTRGREIVIENDIAWRIHTMVDFMFGKPPTIESLAPDRAVARRIEQLLSETFENSGGIGFFQDMALLGAIYGFVDVMVRPGLGADPAGEAPVELEAIEAPRAVPVIDGSDYRNLAGYLLHYTQPLHRLDRGSFLSRLMHGRCRQATVEVTEVWTAEQVRTWHDGREVWAGPNMLGAVPVVHIQNLPQPLVYEGISEVEPLIPLQDELNTRLSDRANRVTLQSFQMYLAKGIENFAQRPIGPGQMWLTENPAASIQAFGGDGGPNPSEDAHINEIREALDKASGVTALAAGVLRNKIGNLTSENALRVTLLGLLAKTQRKRIAYGRGIERICAMVLHALDIADVVRTEPQDRKVCLHWPSPLPENTEQRLREAKLKLQVGVPRPRVLAELGYCGTE